jgi:hypothetical protein
MSKLEGLTRRVVGNRRRHERKRRIYEVVIRDGTNRILFRGKTVNVSRSGARMTGMPATVGANLGQRVCAEFLILPKDVARIAKRVAVAATVWRIEEFPDEYNMVVQFERELPD